MKHQRREERRRERERRRNDKSKRPVKVKEHELGPLGNFLKSIIIANTFVD